MKILTILMIFNLLYGLFSATIYLGLKLIDHSYWQELAYQQIFTSLFHSNAPVRPPLYFDRLPGEQLARHKLFHWKVSVSNIRQ